MWLDGNVQASQKFLSPSTKLSYIRYLIRPTSFPQFSKILHCRMTEIAQTLNIKALISSMFPNHFHNNGQRLALLIEMALQYKFKAAWS